MQHGPLILPAEQIHLVLRRQRSLLIEPCAAPDAAIPPTGKGATVPLQPASSRPATCRVTVLDRPRLVTLGDLDDEEARALGRHDLEELMAAWVETYGLWNENETAWLIPVAVDPASPSRLLHRDSLKGYTTSPAEALPNEKEAVDDTELERASLAADRAERERFERQLAEQRARPLPQRLQRAIDAAATRGINIDHALFLVGKQAEALDRIVYSPADRTRDAEIIPSSAPRERRAPRRLNPEAAERRRRQRESRAPGALHIRHVDPDQLESGQPVPPPDA